ncbi:hypothetical protein [Yinghuangia soli]|uniref:Alpha/beta hydrolase n=1 Tax=Yinghuangia soli TaxID=2908204 RepID=A0AA41Q5E4_9ACTN|nr:hypothetical protein [Yinghuangia soli]MCF2531547.1 hypothetical protein [Yinghuangia soli]
MTRAEVRSLWWAIRVPGNEAPYDTAHLRVYYPARRSGTDHERLTGTVPAVRAARRYPVAVVLSGVNVGQDSYRHLAVRLCQAGLVAVTCDFVSVLPDGAVATGPGIDVTAVVPGGYGEGATTPLPAALLKALSDIAAPESGTPLAGLLDLGRIAWGGHSAGGTLALQSAGFLPGTCAVFAYGAHTRAATMLGWPAGTYLDVRPGAPVLLAAGGRDGVIAASADRYGDSADGKAAEDPVARTFDEALPDGDGQHLLVVFPDAGHFALAHPLDPTSARSFLEDGAFDTAYHEAVADVVADFCAAHLADDPSARDRLYPSEKHGTYPNGARFRRR